MSDYIPKTANVRDAYSSESSDSTYANRMFDSWLARYKAKVIAKTEERIIKLLEDKLEDFIQTWDGSGEPYSTVDYIGLTALIKGENK